MASEEVFELGYDRGVSGFESDFAGTKNDPTVHKVVRPAKCHSATVRHGVDDVLGMVIDRASIERFVTSNGHANTYQQAVSSADKLPTTKVQPSFFGGQDFPKFASWAILRDIENRAGLFGQFACAVVNE